MAHTPTALAWGASRVVLGSLVVVLILGALPVSAGTAAPSAHRVAATVGLQLVGLALVASTWVWLWQASAGLGGSQARAWAWIAHGLGFGASLGYALSFVSGPGVRGILAYGAAAWLAAAACWLYGFGRSNVRLASQARPANPATLM